MIKVRAKLLLPVVVLAKLLDSVSTYCVADTLLSRGYSLREIIPYESNYFLSLFWRITGNIPLGIALYFFLMVAFITSIIWGFSKTEEKDHSFSLIFGLGAMLTFAIAAISNFLWVSTGEKLVSINPSIAIPISFLTGLAVTFFAISKNKTFVKIN